MGRRPLHLTKEEKAAAAAKRSAAYYKRNAEAICASRKAKYVPKPRLPATGPSDEEKKVKNREKSARWYQKNKSRVKQVREMRRPKRPSWHSGCILHAGPNSISAWRERLDKIDEHLCQALNGKVVGEFVDDVAVAYISQGDRKALDDAPQPFHGILSDLAKHEEGVLNTLGAGVHLGEVHELRKEVNHVIELLENLVSVAIEKETVARFLKVYEDGDFFHHTLYFEDYD